MKLNGKIKWENELNERRRGEVGVLCVTGVHLTCSIVRVSFFAYRDTEVKLKQTCTKHTPCIRQSKNLLTSSGQPSFYLLKDIRFILYFVHVLKINRYHISEGNIVVNALPSLLVSVRVLSFFFLVFLFRFIVWKAFERFCLLPSLLVKSWRLICLI